MVFSSHLVHRRGAAFNSTGMSVGPHRVSAHGVRRLPGDGAQATLLERPSSIAIAPDTGDHAAVIQHPMRNGCWSSSVVEHVLGKDGVTGSIPVSSFGARG